MRRVHQLVGELMVTLMMLLLFALTLDPSASGQEYVRSFVLQWLLWRPGSIPWNYRRFLDSATDRLLLRKVGGYSGYVDTF